MLFKMDDYVDLGLLITSVPKYGACIPVIV